MIILKLIILPIQNGDIMRRRNTIIMILLLFTFGLSCMITLPQVEAISEDYYKVEVGDYFIWNMTDGSSQYYLHKYQILSFNVSTDLSCWGHSVWVSRITYYGFAPYFNWSNEITFQAGMYNLSDPKLVNYAGYECIPYQYIWCENLTTLNASFFAYWNYHKGANATSWNGSANGVFSVWNGTASGDGLSTSAEKYNITIDPQNHVTLTWAKYNWTGSEWILSYKFKLIESGHVPPTPPPIPAFELTLILIVCGLIMIFYYKRQSKDELIGKINEI